MRSTNIIRSPQLPRTQKSFDANSFPAGGEAIAAAKLASFSSSENECCSIAADRAWRHLLIAVTVRPIVAQQNSISAGCWRSLEIRRSICKLKERGERFPAYRWAC